MNVEGLPIPPRERYLTRKQLAELMGVSARTIDRMIADGMPATTFGVRCVRFQASTAIAWANGRDVGSRQPNREETAA